MAAKNTAKTPPNLGFLALQEVAWTLGLIAMAINAANRGFDWIWVGLLVCWQASIVWGFVKLSRARTS
ncbi:MULTISPECIES: hypothetical protein [unclassified Paenarthrobacter]|jgi:hypothetical protein|uniref:hypothetical protein n=1 Tax=Paenarthrobacter TaxID=1742992 RepID=UPI000368DBD3|nr:hypothetical protein [Paenarthrobacter sp. YJN-D]BCW12217.1 hypothetical protein NtRootA2_34990 [Arthrobacter sp. NtRootA2]BCW16299.1 hypothetical protein NtRootA4_32780 [Arthrobacter sp. NtRootA4]BCW24631.1 hypothetical protein NtRootC7_34980 [Arthrobacter sp. NtRootC7]BCW28902.1 hypothetical protein NtRootC45_35020 [Arthrobacter sp. NtRootC45]BCW33172.1 hypothetical protein NtRootD5_35030 [Arthrobacter sp. NtRootD5]